MLTIYVEHIEQCPMHGQGYLSAAHCAAGVPKGMLGLRNQKD